MKTFLDGMAWYVIVGVLGNPNAATILDLEDIKRRNSAYGFPRRPRVFDFFLACGPTISRVERIKIVEDSDLFFGASQTRVTIYGIRENDPNVKIELRLKLDPTKETIVGGTAIFRNYREIVRK